MSSAAEGGLLASAQVFGGDKGKTRRVANLQSDVAALEAAIEAARAEYDRVLDRNLKVLLTLSRMTPPLLCTLSSEQAGG